MALFYEPLNAAGKAFSESASGSVSQSEVAIGFLSPIPDRDRDTDADSAEGGGEQSETSATMRLLRETEEYVPPAAKVHYAL